MASIEREEDSTEEGPLQPAGARRALIESVLDVEEISTDLYRGHTVYIPDDCKFVFGGQIMGQALVAAGHTVPGDRHVHSLQCHFIRPGDWGVPITYQVERTRDGKTFSTRSVTASQRAAIIFTCQMSFHRAEDSPLRHQDPMPDAPLPEELLTRQELVEKAQSREEGECSFKLPYEVPIDWRDCRPENYFKYREKKKAEPRMLVWWRTRHPISTTNVHVHHCIAAYVSDHFIICPVAIPHPDIEVDFWTSLNHSIWFHSPFRTDDEWLLYEMSSAWAGGGRGLAFGHMFARDGRLVMSVVQECLIRQKASHESPARQSRL